MPLLRRSGSCCDVSQAVPPSYSGSAGSKRSTAAAGQSTQVMLGSLIAIISIRTALAIMSIRTARAWLRAAARAPRSVPGRLRANFVKALYGRACRMTHAHVHAGSCRGVYTQEKHRSQARLRPTGLGRWTGCEKELFAIWNLLCPVCGERRRATFCPREGDRTRTTMAVPVVCVERAVFRSLSSMLSSGGVIK